MMTHPEAPRTSTRTSARRLRAAIPAVRALVAAGAAVALGSVVLPSAASATTQTKFYAASADLSSIYAFAPTWVTVKLANSSSSTQSFASAELTVGNLPASDVTVGAPSIGSWVPTVVSTSPTVIKLTSPTGPAIAPGQFVSLPLKITAPASPSSFTIATQVKQSNDFSGSGNGFLHVSGNSDPAITVLLPPLTLKFGQEPPAALQQSIPPSNFSYMCPAVSVQLYYGSSPVAAPGVTVSLSVPSGSPDPGLVYAPSKTISAQTDSTGLATFGTCTSGLGATVLGPRFLLQASSPAAADPVDSTSFGVSQVVKTCNGSCDNVKLSSSISGTTANENADSPNGGTFGLTASFGEGLTLVCDSQVSTVPADPLVTTTTDSDSGLISLTFPKAVVNSVPDNGAPHMPVCVGADQAFPNSSAVTPTDTSPYPFQGLLLDCSSSTYMAEAASFPIGFCVQSRAKIATGAETVVISTTSLNDPMAW